MKITEIITEAENKSVEEVAQILRRDCGPFLKEINYQIGTYPLLRGVRMPVADITIVTTNKSRKPVDMPKVVSEAIDDYFQETTGIRWRSSSVFASGNPNAALYYGNLFCVFPIGEFHYCWSQRVGDLFNSLDNQLAKNKLSYSAFSRNIFADESTEEYYAERRKEAFTTLHDVIMPSFGYQVDTELTEAISMAHSEIMISCDKYYLVSSSMFKAITRTV